MKAETLEAYRPLLRSILGLQGFQFENVFSFRVKGEEIVDALSGKSQFFDIGTKGNKLLRSLYQQWKSTQRPSSVVLKDHIMSIFPIQEDVDGMDFLGMLRERSDGELSPKEEVLIQLMCAELGTRPEVGAAAPDPAAASEIERLSSMLDAEREAYQKEMRQVLIRTRELEEGLRVAEENVSSFQKLAEELQETASREQQLRLSIEDELRRRDLEHPGAVIAEPSEKYTAQIVQIEGQRDEALTKVAEIDLELATAKEQLERIDEERSAESMQHSTEVDTLMGDLSQLQARERDLQLRVDDLEQQRSRLTQDLDQARAAAATGGQNMAQLQALHAELAAVHTALAEARTDLARRVETQGRFEDELAQEKEITARLFSELEDVRRERDEKELRGEALESEVRGLRGTAVRLGLLQSAHDVLAAERGRLAEMCTGLEAEIVDLRPRAEQATVLGDRVEGLEESLQLMQGRFQEASDLLGVVLKSRDKYRSVMDSQVNPIFMLDRQLVVLHLNRAMLSYTQEHQFQKIIGRRCYESLGLPGICPGCPILKSLESGKLEGNLVTMNIGNEDRLFLISAYPTLDAQSNITTITEFMEEVTDRVAAIDRLRKLNAERQRLIDQAEGTPLSTLRLLLEALGSQKGQADE